ncbi:MAG: SDR family oxidoreductase [Beijerinckiaceae bacterium]
MNRVRQPVALVTGGARRIGRSLVQALAQNGYAVAIHHNTAADEAAQLQADIQAQGGNSALVAGDLALPSAALKIAEDAHKALGPVTLLVNNASLFVPDRMGLLDDELWQRHFAINLQAPVWLAQAMARALPADAEGCVINIIDQRVLRPVPHFFSYSLTKSALFSATQMMAQALAPRIRVNAVGPGPTLPNVHDGTEGFAQEVASTLLRRAPTPAQIAEAVLYLARASSVTGQMIAVDSGQHLQFDASAPGAPAA